MGYLNEMRIKNTYYLTLGIDRQYDLWLEDCLEQFSAYMAMSPIDIKYCFNPLPEELKRDVWELDSQSSLDAFSGIVLGKLVDDLNCIPNLIILCSPTHPLAALAQEACRTALWGICTEEWLSIIYHLDNEYLVWHEVLHLFGADDCYDLTRNDRGPTCELPNCIMQYEATKDNVGEYPFLCQSNIDKIKNKVSTWTEN